MDTNPTTRTSSQQDPTLITTGGCDREEGANTPVLCWMIAQHEKAHAGSNPVTGTIIHDESLSAA